MRAAPEDCGQKPSSVWISVDFPDPLPPSSATASMNAATHSDFTMFELSAPPDALGPATGILGGLLTDEWINGDSFIARIKELRQGVGCCAAVLAGDRSLVSLIAHELAHNVLRHRARLDAAGVDAILVGDSLGMVIQGGTSTLPVTLDEVIYHCRAVARGTQHAHLIGDMPFMSYQTSPDAALLSAGRLMKEGGAESVKLEGGQEIADVIRRMVRMGIPVMAHVGLMPQRMHTMGGFKVQGRTGDAAESILEDAIAIADAGAFAMVIEGVRVTAKSGGRSGDWTAA